MNLAQTLAHLRNDTDRHVRPLAEARARQSALAPYQTARTLLNALAPSSALATTERNAIVVALVEEHQRAQNPLWPALLACAFAGMLGKLRRRIGKPRDDDYDQRVLAALFEAIARVRPCPYVLLSIRRATEESLFRGLRAEEGAAATFSYDEERHAADPFGPEAQAKVAADEVAQLLEARGDDELLGAIVATYVHEESLRDHVARTHPDAGQEARESVYQRLWLARAEVTRDLRERLGVAKPRRDAA
jgi:hypothetical protein